MRLYNPNRRDMIDQDRLQTELIPANKVGKYSDPPFQRNGGYPAWWLIYEWFLLHSEGDRVIYDMGDVVFDDVGESRELEPEEVNRLREEAKGYEDLTNLIVDYLLEAERISTPEDYREVWLDMGGLVGYAPALRRVWLDAQNTDT
jgi:hypothetical protein